MPGVAALDQQAGTSLQQSEKIFRTVLTQGMDIRVVRAALAQQVKRLVLAQLLDAVGAHGVG